MADLSVTAANVLCGVNAKKRWGVAGATVTAGQTAYEDTSDSNKFKLGDANASATTAKIAGIFLNSAANGQPVQIVYEDDDFTPGATMTVNTFYVASGTAGGIAPVADITTGWYASLVMLAKSTTKAKLMIGLGTQSGVAS